MSILFVPDYSDGNPYQSNLAAALDEDVTYGRKDSRFPVLAALFREDISVVHIHWLNLFFKGDSWRETGVGVGLLLVRVLATRLAGVPIVWTVHNATMHEREHPWLERWFKRWFVTSGTCRRLVVHCEAVADDLVTTFDLPPSTRERIDVIPHGHYLDNYENDLTKAAARESLGIEQSATVFLFFGLIRRYKGVPDLIDAFDAAAVSDSRLLIAGNPATDSLETELEAKTAGNERVLGVYEFVPDAEIQRYMNAADAVVLPFRKVTTSGSAILAMSFGKALVVPRLGCLPELLDEEGAVFYGTSETDGLRRSLERAADRDLTAMGAHNRDRVEAYDWETIAARTEQTYAKAHGETDAAAVSDLRHTSDA